MTATDHDESPPSTQVHNTSIRNVHEGVLEKAYLPNDLDYRVHAVGFSLAYHDKLIDASVPVNLQEVLDVAEEIEDYLRHGRSPE